MMMMMMMMIVIITNSVKRIINKQNVSAKSRMCGEGDETVSHIVSECRKLAQKQFISMLEARQSGADDSFIWNLCGKLGYDRNERIMRH